MMISNPASPVSQYSTIWKDGWTHEWNLNEEANENECRRAIDDYYIREGMVFSPDQAFPQHYAFVRSAHQSASKLLLSSSSSSSSRGKDSSIGVSSTAVSKHHLTTLSAMTGLLVSRIFGNGRRLSVAPALFPFGDLHTKTKEKYAEFANRYIHSALAAEYIIGNRYFRTVTNARKALVALAASLSSCENDYDDLITLQQQQQQQFREFPVGFLESNAKKNLTANDITPQSLENTKQNLCKAYSTNIDRLMLMIQQFRHGFVSLESIRTDPEFVHLMTMFWRYSNQLMKLNSSFEERDATVALNLSIRATQPTDYFTFGENKDAKRFVVLSLISEPAALVPLLFHYDVACIFDNWRESYRKYIKTVKSTFARLANDGSVASFLAFTAVEPKMTTRNYAVKLSGNSAYHTISMKSCANHIPSRHPVFGALRIKHRHHIKRTADVMNWKTAVTSANPQTVNTDVPRSVDRHQPTYNSFSEMVDDIRRPESILDFSVKLKTVTKVNRGEPART